MIKIIRNPEKVKSKFKIGDKFVWFYYGKYYQSIQIMMGGNSYACVEFPKGKITYGKI